jgi:large-conductance mechanosensitive channel
VADPNGLEAFAVLFTALGLSGISGLRAYFPLLAVAVGSDVPGTQGGHLIQLEPWLRDLDKPWVIALLVVLALGEFTVDKVPVLDHISDVLHTVIRPLSGALIMAGVTNPLVSNTSPIVAGIIGAALALTVHSAKAAVVRPVTTATTAGIGNPIVSVIEDIFTTIIAVLALAAPVIAIILFVIVAIFVFRLIRKGWRKMRSRKNGQAVAVGPPNQPTYMR